MRRRFKIAGPKGSLSVILEAPDLQTGQKCPVVVLMHGFMANKSLQPIKGIAKDLLKSGFACVRFDFDGHGRSEGMFSEMTVETELSDARVILDYVFNLPFVSKVFLVGHSQGGVVAGMIAGEYGSDRIAAIVLLAAAAVLKDDALNGTLMGKKYDPNNPPEHLRVFFHKVGRKYFSVAQNLEIFERSSVYDGPVCIIHGMEDDIVPYRYSRKYDESYLRSELHLLEGENHLFSKRRKEMRQIVKRFIENN